MTPERPQLPDFRPQIMQDRFLGLTGNPEELRIVRENLRGSMQRFEDTILGREQFTPQDATILGIRRLEQGILQYAVLGRTVEIMGDTGSAQVLAESVKVFSGVFSNAASGNNASLKWYINALSESTEDLIDDSMTAEEVKRRRDLSEKYRMMEFAIPEQSVPLVSQDLEYVRGGLIRPDGYDYEREFAVPPYETTEELGQDLRTALNKVSLYDLIISLKSDISPESALEIALEREILDQRLTEVAIKDALKSNDTLRIEGGIEKLKMIDYLIKSVMEGNNIPLKTFFENDVPDDVRRTAQIVDRGFSEDLKKSADKYEEIAAFIPEVGPPMSVEKLREIMERILM